MHEAFCSAASWHRGPQGGGRAEPCSAASWHTWSAGRRQCRAMLPLVIPTSIPIQYVAVLVDLHSRLQTLRTGPRACMRKSCTLP